MAEVALTFLVMIPMTCGLAGPTSRWCSPMVRNSLYALDRLAFPCKAPLCLSLRFVCLPLCVLPPWHLEPASKTSLANPCNPLFPAWASLQFICLP